jgi:WD40 repeat protein
MPNENVQNSRKPVLQVAVAALMLVAVVAVISSLVYLWCNGVRTLLPHKQKERMTMKGHHREEILALAFSPDGKTLASSGGRESSVLLWDVRTGKLHATLQGHSGVMYCLAFAPDGRSLVASDGVGKFIVWDVNTGKELTTLVAHKDIAHCVAYSPDGTMLATGCSDGTVKLWDVKTWKERATLTGHTGNVDCLAFSPDGKTLASGTDDVPAIHLWDMATLEQKSTLPGEHWVHRVVFSPDGKTLATLDSRSIKLWDLATGRERRPYPVSAGVLGCPVFTPDGKRLACTAGNRVVLWNVETGQEEDTVFVGHVTDISCLAISADGKTLAAGSGGQEPAQQGPAEFTQGPGEIKLWDLPNP